MPINEWDDAVHVKRDVFVPYGDLDARAIEEEGSSCGSAGGAGIDTGVCSALEGRAEHEKRWNYAQCRAYLNCVRDTVRGGWFKLEDGWRQTVQCADRIKNFGHTLFDYCSRYPVTCEVTKWFGGGAVGYGVGQMGGGGGAMAQALHGLISPRTPAPSTVKLCPIKQ